MINDTIMKYENKEKKYQIYAEILVEKKPWVEEKFSL